LCHSSWSPRTTEPYVVFDHTALTYIYDPEGRLRLAMGHKQTTEHYITDLRKLMSPGA